MKSNLIIVKRGTSWRNLYNSSVVLSNILESAEIRLIKQAVRRLWDTRDSEIWNPVQTFYCLRTAGQAYWFHGMSFRRYWIFFLVTVRFDSSWSFRMAAIPDVPQAFTLYPLLTYNPPPLYSSISHSKTIGKINETLIIISLVFTKYLKRLCNYFFFFHQDNLCYLNWVRNKSGDKRIYYKKLITVSYLKI